MTKSVCLKRGDAIAMMKCDCCCPQPRNFRLMEWFRTRARQCRACSRMQIRPDSRHFHHAQFGSLGGRTQEAQCVSWFPLAVPHQFASIATHRLQMSSKEPPRRSDKETFFCHFAMHHFVTQSFCHLCTLLFVFFNLLPHLLATFLILAAHRSDDVHCTILNPVSLFSECFE